MGQGVLESYARWLGFGPYFQVAGPVVGSVAIQVVNGLSGPQRPSQELLGHNPVHVLQLAVDPGPQVAAGVFPGHGVACWHAPVGFIKIKILQYLY